jgi:hypothetical protein
LNLLKERQLTGAKRFYWFPKIINFNWKFMKIFKTHSFLIINYDSITPLLVNVML